MRKKADEINIAPLVDVLLVLLVIFMITAPMMYKEINVDLPQVVSVTQSKNVIKNDVVITISIDAKKNIFFNSKNISFDELIKKLKSIPKDAVISVEASKELSYQMVYSLLSSIQAADFYNISLCGFY